MIVKGLNSNFYVNICNLHPPRGLVSELYAILYSFRNVLMTISFLYIHMEEK